MTTPGETVTPAPIIVETPHLKAGRVACATEAEAAQARGMDAFAAWIRQEVLGECSE